MKRFAGRVLLFVLSSLSALGLAELTLRVAYPQQLGVWYSLRSGLVIHPPGTRIYLANFRQTVEFNSLGMRDVEHSEVKDPGVFRVLVLGDSFMEALQVPLEESFPRLLEQRLQTLAARRVEVISCAVSGWGTGDQLEYLTHYGRTFSPDLILVAMTLHNDVSDNLEERFHTLVEGRVVPRVSSEMPSGEFRLLRLKGYLASRSHLVQLFRKYRHLGQMRVVADQLDSHVRQLIDKDEPETVRKGWRLTRELMLGIREQGARVGARTAVMLIPLFLQIDDDKLRGWLAANRLRAEDLALDRPQERMHGIGEAAGVVVIDLLPAFRSTRREGGLYLVRDGHWNSHGHQLAAAVVGNELVARKLLDAPAVSSRR
jgi:acetyltransferase AlgX (SGNH hydrolase-like protein)